MPDNATGAAKSNLPSRRDPGFGIYVHWPFCLAKCPYCDFNSHVRHQRVDTVAFGDGLVAELGSFHSQTADRTVTSIFFGGGTPSLMPAMVVGQVIDAIARLWTCAPDMEVTLEANPTSIEAGRFGDFRTAGVNRASVGVQALNDADLKALGRQHSAKEAIAAYEIAANTFSRTSFDLIYARPGQSVQSWREELQRAVALQQGHMSLYQLTIEPQTPYQKLFDAGKLQIPDDDEAAALYDVTAEITRAAGLQRYEISNHALAGEESRHNLLYWQYGEYLGVGAGAHSRILTPNGRLALENEKTPEKWLAMVTSCGRGTLVHEHISRADEAREFMMMGLRLARGVDLSRAEQLFAMQPDTDKIADLVAEKLVVYDRQTQQLAATARGSRVLNAVIGYLL